MGQADMPGAVPTGAAPPIPTWVLAGWSRVASANAGTADVETQKQLSVLADYLSAFSECANSKLMRQL